MWPCLPSVGDLVVEGWTGVLDGVTPTHTTWQWHYCICTYQQCAMLTRIMWPAGGWVGYRLLNGWVGLSSTYMCDQVGATPTQVIYCTPTNSLGVMSYVKVRGRLGSFKCHFVSKSLWWYFFTTSPLQLHQTRWNYQFGLELINICLSNLREQWIELLLFTLVDSWLVWVLSIITLFPYPGRCQRNNLPVIHNHRRGLWQIKSDFVFFETNCLTLFIMYPVSIMLPDILYKYKHIIQLIRILITCSTTPAEQDQDCGQWQIQNPQ